MSVALPEPQVLAAAKEELYPDLADRSNAYAVTDNQFTVDQWGEWQIPEEVRDTLQPFNIVRMSSGEPDLLAVGLPDTKVLNEAAASTPVVVVEAKGNNAASEDADITRGIEQVHARMSEANLGFVAAPLASVSETAQSLARDLNVGVLGVQPDGAVAAIEPARVTGAGDFSTDINAIRFQATNHQLTAASFPVNHPKNFLGYALALADNRDTHSVYDDHVIRRAADGRRGALLLNLVEESAGELRLTHLGQEVVRFARVQCGSVANALELMDGWTGKRERFTEYAPRWAQLARSVMIQYEPTQLIVEALERLHSEGLAAPQLPDLVREGCRINRPLAIEVFFATGKRDRVLAEDGSLVDDQLTNPDLYKSGAHFQYKAGLYHVGILTSRGTDDAEVAMTDTWAVETAVGD
jgi:hypothetical protein